MNVLIIDDNDSKRKKISKVLVDSFGHESLLIEEAQDSSEAMSILIQKVQLDLLILDLNLPIRKGGNVREKSGLKLLREIKRRPKLVKPESIIGLTAYKNIAEDVREEFNQEGWVVVEFNPAFSLWEDVIINKVNYLIGKQKQTPSNLNNDLPHVVILTAIKEEYLSVRRFLTQVEDSSIHDTSYETGTFFLEKNPIAQVTIRECGATNTLAAIETERAINNFSPDMMLFVGIAGSRKEEDFVIGDVIVPTKIYSYEGGKSGRDIFNSRPDTGYLSYTFIEMAKKERLKDDWKNIALVNFNNYNPKVDLGVIASGDILIEHYYSHIGQVLSEHYNDTSAVEMEGFGFSKTLSRQGRNTSNLIIGLVRGISDVLEKESEVKYGQDRRPQNAKALACNTSATFAYWMIFKLFQKLD
ncbi:5'-methylthioadenosine/S-adenosylhomocysteine nucleosidase [bacterium]|nr:5'-methylthioadenosine/S-adenosylhomocysteine nucleosidase [bacterium]